MNAQELILECEKEGFNFKEFLAKVMDTVPEDVLDLTSAEKLFVERWKELSDYSF